MKKIVLLFVCFLLSSPTFAINNYLVSQEADHQKQISEVGVKILNANKIDKRIIFTYNKGEYKKELNDSTLTKRQIIFYEEYFKYVDNDDELAGFLAHEISRAVQSYSGAWGGFVSATQVKAAPKKYEIFADKRAVDYMVKAGYNPLGLITFMNKSTPSGIFGKIFHNSTSKRMAIVYEYIYFNYPYYLKNNTYLSNQNYQNFLLNSASNRALLKEKIKSGSNKELKYE